MALPDPEVTINKLVEQGAVESAARELVGISRRCKSIEELRNLIGEPDRIIEWDDALEKKIEHFSADFSKPVKRWKKCHSYHRRWLPVHFYVYEQSDGSLAYAFAVVNEGKKGRPAI